MSVAPGVIYGANGFTGRAIARRAVERGLRPWLAGRSAAALGAVAAETGLEARAVALEDGEGLRRLLGEAGAVVHAAGPFEETWLPMVEACLASGCHYLDITGEWQVFEAVHGRDAEARAAGVALVPGVGFDVVPTDAVAAALAARLPDATHLELAFVSSGSPSRGTMRTAMRQFPRGGAARVDGRIQVVPHGWKQRDVPFGDRSRRVASVAWGDVSTAWRSTGIPNVVVYTSMPSSLSRIMRLGERLGGWVGEPRVGRWLDRLARWRAGESGRPAREGECRVWGEARNPSGRTVSAGLRTPDGYALTADAATRALERALGGLPPGAWTPSRLWGTAFASSLDGVRWE